MALEVAHAGSMSNVGMNQMFDVTSTELTSLICGKLSTRDATGTTVRATPKRELRAGVALVPKKEGRLTVSKEAERPDQWEMRKAHQLTRGFKSSGCIEERKGCVTSKTITHRVLCFPRIQSRTIPSIVCETDFM